MKSHAWGPGPEGPTDSSEGLCMSPDDWAHKGRS